MTIISGTADGDVNSAATALGRYPSKPPSVEEGKD
jgi:hypothetical protein